MRRHILCAVLVLAASTAHADDKKKAKALYDEGLNHYNLAEYPDAIKAWREAYRLAKKPLLLFNIGQAYRLSGDCKQAMIFYDSYQREEPSPKNQDELDEALKLCKEAKPGDVAAKPGEKPIDKPVGITPVGTKPADKPVGTQPAGTKPVDKPVGTQPVGTPSGTTDKPADKPATQVGQLDQGSPEEPVDQGETTTGGGLRKIGIGVGAAGVVLGGVGVFFAVKSGKASKDLDGFQGEWGQDEIDLEARGKRDAKLGLALGIGGAAALVAGGVMFAIGGPKAVETNTVSLVPTRGGAALGWSYRF